MPGSQGQQQMTKIQRVTAITYKLKVSQRIWYLQGGTDPSTPVQVQDQMQAIQSPGHRQITISNHGNYDHLVPQMWQSRLMYQIIIKGTIVITISIFFDCFNFSLILNCFYLFFSLVLNCFFLLFQSFAKRRISNFSFLFYLFLIRW